MSYNPCEAHYRSCSRYGEKARDTGLRMKKQPNAPLSLCQGKQNSTKIGIRSWQVGREGERGGKEEGGGTQKPTRGRSSPQIGSPTLESMGADSATEETCCENTVRGSCVVRSAATRGALRSTVWA